MRLHIVVLAAGQGKRMNSARPKVLQPLGDRSMLAHVIATASALAPEAIHIVHGHGGDAVQAALADADVRWAHQAEQLGTGHAVAQALCNVPDAARVLVLYGDVPLVTEDTLKRLVAAADDDRLALLTVALADPTGYGRIVRGQDGAIQRVVEEKDATAAERTITETNTGLLCVGAARLRKWLSRVHADNAQGEYYLTDCIGLAAADRVAVAAGQADTAAETQGVNNKHDLARAERLLQARQADALLARGVTLRDPARLDIRGTVSTGRDVEIDVGVVLEGDVELADEVVVGAHCVLRDCRLGAGTEVAPYSIIDGAEIGAGCTIGPFARIRPATRLADGAKIGNFVETKKADIGAKSKINHLSYVGDAVIGRDVNIGAGVITCNYDGVAKRQTTIGDEAFIGSDCQLVAPVTVGERATVGAGTTVAKEAPANALTVGRARQKTIPGWQRPKK